MYGCVQTFLNFQLHFFFQKKFGAFVWGHLRSPNHLSWGGALYRSLKNALIKGFRPVFVEKLKNRCHLLLLKVLLFQTTKKSIKNVAVAVAAAAAAVFWGFYKKCLLSSFPYGIHCLKSYVQYCKHGLVCDPCDFEMILLLWRQLLANSQWSVHVCLCVPLWLVFLVFFFASACLVVLLPGWFACWLPAWLAG